ncbi:MAG: ribonuclease P protein component [Micavibrio aeruginosavorus]|uniref:Ribonuclease P protein component n=1 Tax=Micavibrio aeruginosavorus TaxID=349221 RepID=A0A2W5Q300_9BACT|nr:MAG: ribonuclease P protein component [Micavibrio aeruginosavorus]
MKATKKDLQKLGRLQKRSDFLRFNKDSARWVSKGFTLLALPNDLPIARVGFTVTKKIEKSAVKRNRMKRRLRAIAADVLPCHAKAGVDYVLIAREPCATRLFADMTRDLRWCLEKLGHAVD